MRNTNETFYGHMRNINDDQTVSGKGGTTVAFRIVPKGVQYGVAHCNEADTFNKRLGRTIAKGRLDKNKSAFLEIDVTNMNPGDVAHVVLEQALKR